MDEFEWWLQLLSQLWLLVVVDVDDVVVAVDAAPVVDEVVVMWLELDLVGGY